MARLMMLCGDRLVTGDVVSDRVLGWTGDPRAQADNVPLRLAGALHALRIEGLALEGVYPPEQVDDDVLWTAVRDALVVHDARILRWLENAPQTNEVRRASVILPSLALAEARFGVPFQLLELGSSGGLNLFADQFHLQVPDAELGAVGSAVLLSPEWSGPAPCLRLPQISGRAGVDLNPLDPSKPADQLRLLAYLWPDQADRIARIRAAIEIAEASPAAIDTEDAGTWLTRQLEQVPEAGRFVFHTIAAQYFSDQTRHEVATALKSAAKHATQEHPLVYLSVEADGGLGAAVVLTMWPEGDVREIARMDFHGRWVNWTGLWAALDRHSREEPMKKDLSINVLGEPLESCSTDPITGFFRDGACNTCAEDTGKHTVCAVLTAEFLAFSKYLGNDLSTPRPEYMFAGLNPGDCWCLCASRFLQAAEEGVGPRIRLAATHSSTLDIVPLDVLMAHAVED